MRAPFAHLVAFAKLARHLLHMRYVHLMQKMRWHDNTTYYGVSSTHTAQAVSTLPES